VLAAILFYKKLVFFYEANCLSKNTRTDVDAEDLGRAPNELGEGIFLVGFEEKGDMFFVNIYI